MLLYCYYCHYYYYCYYYYYDYYYTAMLQYYNTTIVHQPLYVYIYCYYYDYYYYYYDFFYLVTATVRRREKICQCRSCRDHCILGLLGSEKRIITTTSTKKPHRTVALVLQPPLLLPGPQDKQNTRQSLKGVSCQQHTPHRIPITCLAL